jgi:hypothetical protein
MESAMLHNTYFSDSPFSFGWDSEQDDVCEISGSHGGEYESSGM